MIPSTLAAEVDAALELGSGIAPWTDYSYRVARYGVNVTGVDWHAVHPVPPPCPERVALSADAVRFDARVSELTAAGLDLEDARVKAADDLGLDAFSRHALEFRAGFGTDVSADAAWLDALGPCEQCVRCAAWFSPFHAATLAAAAEFFAASMHLEGPWDASDAEADEPPLIAHHLPRVAQPFLDDTAWFVELQHAFHLVAARLAAGELPFPRCTGEEMALHAALSLASAITQGQVPTGPVLPAVGMTGQEWLALEHECDQDDGWLSASFWLFADHDVLMLFDPQMDGIEDPESDLGLHMGVVNLHPADWFMPFRSA
jgi:hypothetical protein